ncbi:MAG TPA: substrate-binding domain-containing protein [Solirubrobacterales bacterium]|nr:substrate-binding domain-containing protein [Solirubrobacterales bacterium]
MKMWNWRLAAALAVCALLAGAVAACGSSSGSGSGATASEESTEAAAGEGSAAGEGEAEGGGTEPAASTEGAPSSALVKALPKALQEQYVGLPSERVESKFASFKAVKQPWKVCYSESYQGNPWRVKLAEEMKRLASEYEEAGLVSGFTMSVAEEDVARQNQQIRQFVSQGCSIIFAVAGSATGLNAAIKDAYEHGIPFVTMAGSVTSPYAENVDSNYYVLGKEFAQDTAEAGGEILMIKGLEGSPISALQNEGAKAEWAQDGASIAAEVNGNWTPSTTKQVTLQTLATHPSGIDAVWSTGSESAVIAEAFSQSGQEMPLITASISGDALGYWKEHEGEFKFAGAAIMPSWTAETGFRVGMRTLAGNGPKMTPIIVPIPPVTEADLPELYESCMTASSSDVFPVVKEDPLTEKLMDAYFTKPGEVGPYEYANTPKPCAGS